MDILYMRMPKKYTHKNKKTRAPRRYRRYKPKVKRPLTLTGFPTRKFAKLRYADEFTINPGAGTVASYVFRANSAYDPDLTGTGHQPRGFDQWMTIYNNFVILGAKITLEPIPASTGTTNPSTWGVQLTATGTETTGKLPSDMLEAKFNRHKVTSYGVLHPETKLINKFSAKRFFGVKDIIGDDQFQGTASSNPANMAYFEVWAYGNAMIDAGALWFRVIIDYIICFTEPKSLAES